MKSTTFSRSATPPKQTPGREKFIFIGTETVGMVISRVTVVPRESVALTCTTLVVSVPKATRYTVFAPEVWPVRLLAPVTSTVALFPVSWMDSVNVSLISSPMALSVHVPPE